MFHASHKTSIKASGIDKTTSRYLMKEPPRIGGSFCISPFSTAPYYKKLTTIDAEAQQKSNLPNVKIETFLHIYLAVPKIIIIFAPSQVSPVVVGGGRSYI